MKTVLIIIAAIAALFAINYIWRANDLPVFCTEKYCINDEEAR